MADIARIVEEFAALSAKDRRAIERHLSPHERRSLQSAISRSAPKPAPQPASNTSPSLAGYSPWLAKRLTRLINQPVTPGITDAARAAINAALAKSPKPRERAT